MTKRLIELDPWLEPYADALEARAAHVAKHSARILGGKTPAEFALGYLHFGLHKQADGWVLREWAPHATKILLVGDHNNWQAGAADEFARNGDEWTLTLPPETLAHGMNYKLLVSWDGGEGLRLPAYVRYVVQDLETHLFSAQVWDPSQEFEWTDQSPSPASEPLRIYEAHIGMSGEDGAVATYAQFEREVLPRIDAAGYDTVQLMAIAEHPYYGSFGYHVSNYFAPSSRFGTPDELKSLINTAHRMGLRVIMDIVHSHAVKNEVEGLGKQDGSSDLYFRPGEQGYHEQWDSRVFDYGKPEVAHFLLSNVRYWLDEFHFDGYRFDGVTSMLYKSHGLEKSFSSYDDYFSNDTDLDALTYLTLANRVAHDVKPSALTIAEDMSAMPGLALAIDQGGIGFDYRLSMGVPDMWTKTLKHTEDESWDLASILHELTQHRPEERTISYAESHDQALVGDKTLMFRLADQAMYEHMSVSDDTLEIARAMALHKMIRLLTASTNSGGYLSFMGNEFGHPEWIDFPREGNDWSYHYARRQWSLVDDTSLKFAQLGAFDACMTALLAELHGPLSYTYVHQDDGVISYARGEYICVFNFSPTESYEGYGVPAPDGNYRVVLSSDAAQFGGYDRVDSNVTHHTHSKKLQLYVPARTAIVLRKNQD